MPTPPFSQDRRDWLSEISGLFSARKAKNASTLNRNLSYDMPKAFDSTSTLSRDDGPTNRAAMAGGLGQAPSADHGRG